jgi:hypothetical protein
MNDSVPKLSMWKFREEISIMDYGAKGSDFHSIQVDSSLIFKVEKS